MAETEGEWWVKIGHAFSSHVRDERYLLERYENLATSTADASTRFLIEQILSDERRHHSVFEQLSAAVSFSSSGTEVPGPPDPPAEEIPELLEQTRRLIEFEREDAAALKALDRELRPTDDDTLWRLLVELMELDTTKHLRILRYIERRLETLVRDRSS